MIYDHPLVNWCYGKSPLFLQNAFVSGYGMLQGRERRSRAFVKLLADLKKSEWSTASELKALQSNRLKALIRHAYNQVPYYRRVFEERRLTPSDIQEAEDLYKLPVLTKMDVRRFAPELRARNISRGRYRIGHTGGSTGIPLEFLLDRERITFDHALILRHWSWAGYRQGDRTVILRGLPLVSPDKHGGVYWRFDYAENKIYLSGFHLSMEALPIYLEKLQEWRPRFIAAYPSNLFTLARFMERECVRIPVQAIFTSSEVLTEAERKVIENRFDCKVWDRYGTGERIAVTQQCEFGNYHQNVEFGILQVDSQPGHPASPGQKGELILTGLTNFSMPMIRYAVEDVGSVMEGDCPCGRRLPLAGRVDGRKDDVIVTADGRMMPRAGLDQIHEFTQNIERCQLLQRGSGEITVRVQPRPEFNESDSEEIIRQLRKRLGNSTVITIERVERLELSPTGKQRFIVSEINLDRLSGLENGTSSKE